MKDELLGYFLGMVGSLLALLIIPVSIVAPPAIAYPTMLVLGILSPTLIYRGISHWKYLDK